jgi:N-glycosylase/DNA lyase
MDYTYIKQRGPDLILGGVRNLCLNEIFESGQCFRWERLEPGCWRGVAFGCALTASQDGDILTLHDTDEREFEALWRGYFDLGRDYGHVKEILAADPVMAGAIAFCPGMRVLRQEPWETRVSCILSANNNIARIKGIVERLCGHFGDQVGDGLYSFPSADRLAGLEPEELAPLRAGYRAAYLIGAARKVASGALVLPELYALPLEEARARLLTVTGVGPKVAQCVLLYGFARAECVPVDVWIRRALERFYPDGLPDCHAEFAGLGQQYLFHYIRNYEES